MNDEPLFAAIVPSLASIFYWAEATRGAPLVEEEVALITSQAPSMILPERFRDQLDKARSYADIDPEASWDQWQYLRSEIVRQGVAAGKAFPLPRSQLATDLNAIRLMVMGEGLHKPEVIDHQIAALSGVASNVLAVMEDYFAPK